MTTIDFLKTDLVNRLNSYFGFISRRDFYSAFCLWENSTRTNNWSDNVIYFKREFSLFEEVSDWHVFDVLLDDDLRIWKAKCKVVYVSKFPKLIGNIERAFNDYSLLELPEFVECLSQELSTLEKELDEDELQFLGKIPLAKLFDPLHFYRQSTYLQDYSGGSLMQTRLLLEKLFPDNQKLSSTVYRIATVDLCHLESEWFIVNVSHENVDRPDNRTAKRT